MNRARHKSLGVTLDLRGSLLVAAVLTLAVGGLVWAAATAYGAPTHVQRATTEWGTSGLSASLTAVRDGQGVIRQVHAVQTRVDGVSCRWLVLVYRDGEVVWQQQSTTAACRIVVRPGVPGDTVRVLVGWPPNAFPVEVTW